MTGAWLVLDSRAGHRGRPGRLLRILLAAHLLAPGSAQRGLGQVQIRVISGVIALMRAQRERPGPVSPGRLNG